MQALQPSPTQGDDCVWPLGVFCVTPRAGTVGTVGTLLLALLRALLSLDVDAGGLVVGDVCS